ncbi:MAG: RagB/SusD family nutrient uptake outer membrane protein [Bacteroidota bacterium]|nr:RagB/SusD family nutrient uptake outer membrane protein [Bacteroidota bacterium]
MNSKYKFRFVLVAAAILATVGCTEDFLDTKMDTQKTPEQIATDRASLWYYANAFYSPMTYGFSVLDGNLFAAASDEAQQTAASSNANYFNQGMINASVNPLSGLYKNYYEGIRAANFFLDYSKNGKQMIAMNRDTVKETTSYHDDLNFLKWYRAEAHVARAYYYAELIKMYGGVPIVEKTLDQSAGTYIARSSYDDVVAYIVKEIDTYKDSLQVNWLTTSSYISQDGRFTLGAALAIKARVLLYAASPLHNSTNDVEKWKKAAIAASAVMTTAGLNYDLDATNGYRNYFLGATPLGNKETVLAVRRGANNTMESLNYPIGTSGGNSGVCPSHNLVADYEYIGTPDAIDIYKNRDPRLAATVVLNGSTWTSRTIDESAGGTDDMAKANTSKTGYYLKKFLTDALNLTQGATAQHQWVAYRYAEVLLNYAEAVNEGYGGPDQAVPGNTMTARQALKKVRDRASTLLPLVTTTDQATFRAALKHERRIELAFEDHRYWDLLRWKDAKVVLNQPLQGVKIAKDASGKFSYQVVNIASRVFNDRNYYMPFSRSEVANSNGTLVQNDGY